MHNVTDPYKWMQAVRAGGLVKRLHTVPTINTQNNAAHSWGVAVALIAAELDTPNALRVALLHDVPEVEVGDTPATTKWKYPRVAMALNEAEHEWVRAHGIDIPLNDVEQAALNWADLYELCQHCIDEFMMGNRNVLPIFARCVPRLTERACALAEAGADPLHVQNVNLLNTNIVKEMEHHVSK